MRRARHRISWLLVGGSAAFGTAFSLQNALAQTPEEPRAPSFVTSTNISKNAPVFGSVFPQLAVSPIDDDVVAVAWRKYSLPVDTNGSKGLRTAECHVVISTDSGATFEDTNLMPYLRRERISAAEPELWYCNAPWVAFGPDGKIYAGGALFTAEGQLGDEPKQGRARITVSEDDGATWNDGVHGIALNRFAPGIRGLDGGMEPQHTPWDGANGFVDPQTGTFYSTAGAYVVASEDQANTFGTVYKFEIEGWPLEDRGTFDAAFGILAVGFIARETPIAGSRCPCLALATSTDRGRTFTAHLVAEAGEFNADGTVRYPIVAADGAREGYFAVTAYAPGHESVKVFYTEDAGQTWESASPNSVPPNVPVAYANQVGVGYSTDGQILLAWRGFRRPGAFNTFAALLGDDGSFGPTIKVSDSPSVYPPRTFLGTYGNANGAGDFTTWIDGNGEFAFVAYPYAPLGVVEDPYPLGVVEDTYFARVPLDAMK